MSNGLSRFRCDLDEFMRRKPGRHAINLRVDLLERWLSDIDRFYPLPSLSASVRQDIKRLLAAAPVDTLRQRSLGRQRGVVKHHGNDAPPASRSDTPLDANLL